MRDCVHDVGKMLAGWILILAMSIAVGAHEPRGKFALPEVLGEPQVDASVPVRLSLADLERYALANNPTIAAAESLVEQQQGMWRQVGLYPNPTIGYLRSDASQSGQSETQGVFLSQNVVTAGKLKIARAAAAGEIERNNWNVQAQRMRVLNDVRSRFYEVLGAQETVAGAVELETLAAEGVRLAEQLFKAKQGSRLDVLQAEIQLSAVRTSLQDARFRFQSAWRQLSAVVGMPDLQPTALVGKLDDSLPAFTWQESVQQLLGASPLLQAQASEIRASENDLRLARAQAYPDINVQVVAERDRVFNYETVSTLVSLPVPFFNRNQGNIQSSQARLMQQKQEYERIRLTLIDQLAGSFRQYQTLQAQARRLQDEILPRAKENLDLTMQAYKAGQFDFFRVVSARQLYFQTRLAYIDALTELRKTAINIEGLQLTGGLNPTEAGTALQNMPGVGGAATRGFLLQQMQGQGTGTSQNLPGALQAQ